MSNIIIESVHSKIPFTISDIFENNIIIIVFFAFISVTGSIFLSNFIGEISKNIKEFFDEKSKRKNKPRK